MAITKVGAINTIPTTTDDWTNTVKHINGFINQVNSQAFILSDPLGTASPTIKQGCYINHGGTLYIVDTSDYAPSGSPADGNVYIKLSPSGNTLVGSFITNISSYSYSQQYGNMVSGSDMILPYLLVKSGASWTKYRYQPMSVSAIKTTSVDTGQGAMTFDQGVKTTDNVVFVSIQSKQKVVDINGDTLTDYTENTIYSALLPYIDAIGGTLKAGGYIENTAGTIRISVSYLQRGSSYIRINGTPVVGSSTSVQVNSGGSNTYKYRIVI